MECGEALHFCFGAKCQENSTTGRYCNYTSVDFLSSGAVNTMSDQAQLNGWQKLDKTVDCMKTGDIKCIQGTVETVQDQKLFMDLLASKSQSASLPGLEIGKAGEHVDSLKVTEGKHKLTLAFDHQHGNQLTITDDSPTLMKSLSSAADNVGKKFDAGVQWAKDAIDSTHPGEDIKRANTSDSNLNRRWQAQEKQQGI